jgi:hypothetical protein
MTFFHVIETLPSCQKLAFPGGMEFSFLSFFSGVLVWAIGAQVAKRIFVSPPPSVKAGSDGTPRELENARREAQQSKEEVRALKLEADRLTEQLIEVR